MADGRLLEKVCVAEGVDTTGEGGQGWMGSGKWGGGAVVALASISRSGGGHAYL